MDGRVLFKANVAASETSTPRWRSIFTRPWVCGSANGPAPIQRPIREIREMVGVDPRLNQRWSTRRAGPASRGGAGARHPVPR
ncbi:MAG TPA: hypothetical protein VJN19_03070 [Propionibacteriaceae bacterium]|nr:hypothetical protein [Propionibacteriaceae bacterium]